MSYPFTSARNLRLRHATPGRERWEVDHIFRQPPLAAAMETGIGRYPGIQQVNASAGTGRLLIQFDQLRVKPWQLRDYIVKELKQALLDNPAPADTSHQSSAQTKPPQAPTQSALQKQLARLFDEDLVNIVAVGDSVSVNVLKKPLFLATTDTLFNVIGPITLSLLVATPISGGIPALAKFGLTTKLRQFIFLGATFLGIKSIEGLASYQNGRAWGEYSQETERVLRLKVFEKIQNMDMSYLDNQTPEMLMTLINSDIEKISSFLSQAPPTVWRKWLTVAMGMTILGLISPLALLLTLLPAPYLYFLEKGHFRDAGMNFGKVAMDKDSQNQILAGSLNGIATVKSFAAEEREYQNLDANSDQLQNSRVEAARETAEFQAKNNYAYMMGISIPLVYASFGMMTGRFSFTEVMVQMSMAPTMMEATSGLNLVSFQYQEAKQAAKRLTALMAVDPQIQDGDIVLEKDDVRGDISIKDVTFSYGESPVLKDINLEIPAHKTIALVGSTGSGKSTLTKLLQRLYDVDKGSISLDGHDVRDFQLQNLRGMIGVVSQDIFLFNRSIYENVRYGRPDATQEEVMEACRVAEVLDFVETQPDGFDTPIGDRGQKLSGGQRQRLSIARTILKDPPILILDEATSSVDNKTEAAIQRSVNTLSENRTTIIIAHRLSTIRHADKIYFLKEGAFHESGTHQDLLDHNGEYAQLWNLQVSGEAVASLVNSGVVTGTD